MRAKVVAGVGIGLVLVGVTAAGTVAFRFYRPLWDPSAVRGVATAQSLDPDAIERAVRVLVDTGAPYAQVQDAPEIWVARSGRPRELLASRGFRLVEQLGSGLTFENEEGVKEWWSEQRLTRHYEILRFGSRR